MELNNLTAISPLDGRYRQKVEELDSTFPNSVLSDTG